MLRTPRTSQRGRLDSGGRLLGFGGIRIEDNVLIADKGHGVITSDVPLPD